MPFKVNSKILPEVFAKQSNRATLQALERLRSLPGDHKVAVGLSGGVDSSLTAALLVEAGWSVEGVTLWLMSGKGACCGEGLIDAAGICDQLGIIHHIVDSRIDFEKEIVQELIQGYQNGITPLPCSKCNRSVKFSPMLDWAEKERQISRIATGHYARIRYANDEEINSLLPGNPKGRHKLLRGIDKNKDQSYFLYDLSQEVLGKVVFPLGELTKSDTRLEASKYNLRTAQKQESQDLCLAEHHGSMKEFLDKYIPPRVGEIVHKDGTILGEHDGIEHFTIGQRKGLGISWKEPLHVIRLEPSSNRVIVANRKESGQRSCVVGQINWISIDPPKCSIRVQVQVRYRSKAVNALLKPIDPISKDFDSKRPFRGFIEFDDEQFSISPGQAAVFYKEEVVLGGGIIDRD